VEHSINDLDKSYMKGFNEGAKWQKTQMEQFKKQDMNNKQQQKIVEIISWSIIITIGILIFKLWQI
jgi:hypothetical protein